MRAKWKQKRGFVKMHMLVYTQTLKVLALSVTNDSVANVTELDSVLGQGMDAIGKRCISNETYTIPRIPVGCFPSRAVAAKRSSPETWLWRRA